MKKLLTFGLICGLGLIATACTEVKDDIYDQNLSNEDLAEVIEETNVENFTDEIVDEK